MAKFHWIKALRRNSPGWALLMLVAISFCHARTTVSQGGAEEAVRVKRAGDTIAIENDRVKALLYPSNQKIQQDFFAKKGSRWVLAARSFVPAQPFPAEGNKLFDTETGPHRYLVNAMLTEMTVEREEEDLAVIKLKGSTRERELEESISLKRGQNYFHIEVVAVFPEKPVKLDYLLSTFEFNLDKVPDFVHTPTLKYEEHRWNTPAKDQILGDRSFHAPAIVLQEGSLFTALVPDLKLINEQQLQSPDARREIRIPRNKFSVPVEPDKYTMPTGMDLNVRSGLTDKPVFTFGLIDNIIQHHIRYLHPNDGSMVRTLEKDTLVYGFDLFVGADEPEFSAYQSVTQFIWQQYGHETFKEKRHLAMPFEQYVKTIAGVTFKPMEVQPGLPGYPDTGSFLEFEIDGIPVGGFRSAVPGWLDAIWNSEFWHNVRDATGMYFWGTKLRDSTFIDKARRTINLALLAPQNESGLFPLIYRAETKKWQNNSYDAAHGEYALFGRHEEVATYNVVVMSKTCAHLLEYYQKCEKDSRIIPYVSKYADWLVTVIDEKGSLPSYVASDMELSDVLLKSAHPATSMWFLAELYKVNPKPVYLEGAQRIASYLMNEIIPGQQWVDLEQYFSCGAKPLTFSGDSEQGQVARGNLSVAWAAEGFAALYRACGEEIYLEAGEKCIDYLAFTQCSWDPHFIYTAYPFGGFTVDNADHATMLDARQAEFAEPLIWYGQTLGRQDLIERGVAAARSSVVLINHPLHKINAIYRHTNIYPFGLGPENIDHEGHPQSAMRTHPGWGEGSGIFTGLSDALRALGGAYVDARNNIGVGVDGISVESYNISGQSIRLEITARLKNLPQAWEQPYETTLRIAGLDAEQHYDLVLNHSEIKGIPGSQLWDYPLMILPSGEVIPKRN